MQFIESAVFVKRYIDDSKQWLISNLRSDTKFRDSIVPKEHACGTKVVVAIPVRWNNALYMYTSILVNKSLRADNEQGFYCVEGVWTYVRT